jgi:photosystem II stability/assembly factor-like uncharacterized protein
MRVLRSSQLLAGAALAALALAVPATAGAAVQTSHSGWRWGNPLPQGTALNALDFAGARGYAAGAFGTLLRTADAGATWRGINTGLTEPLGVLRVLGPDSLVVAGRCALRRSDDGGRTFRRLPWTASDASCTGGIVTVSFPSAATGFILLGNGNILRSTDSGRTWSRRTAVPGTAATSASSGVSPTDLVFISDTQGFATTDGGNVFATIDAGNTWTPVVDEPFPMRSVTFVNASVGYAVGDAPFVLATSDGGSTWNELGLPADTPGLRQIRCATTHLCLGLTPAGDRLVRTTDGGKSWVSLSASARRLQAVAFASPGRAVSVGVRGTTVTSDDGGATFSPLGGALPGRFNGLRSSGAGVAYAYGDRGSLARTTDGGLTWTEIDAATSDTVRDVSYVSLRTDNAGNSWQILNAGTALRPQAVAALSSAIVVLAGPVGVRRSTDGGQTFKANPDKVIREDSLFGIDHSGGVVLAFGPKALRLSTNSGRTWTAIKRPTPKTRVNDLDLVGSSTIYLLDATGTMWFTADRGRHWRALAGLGSELGYAVRFSDSRHGYVAVGEFGADQAGYVLRTDDGGRTWQPQLVAARALTANGIAVAGRTSAYALTRSNALFSTTTAGSTARRSRLSIQAASPVVAKPGGTIRIDGRLRGARGGERIVVSLREQGSTRWLYQEVAAASNGTFTVVTRLNHTARFVAQWAGDERMRGTGTPALKVTVRTP